MQSYLNRAKIRLFSTVKRNQYPLYAFGLAAFAFLVIGIACGTAPFGKNSLLVMDSWGQYYPMIVERLRHPFAVWSWNGSLGHSAIVQSAYYTNSLFNYLLLPFSGEARIGMFTIITFLKAELGAFFFAYYLERRSDGVGSAFSAVLGAAYGLSAYLLAFISQPMWLDAVMLLPLLMLGLERMAKGKRPWLYVITLALTIYTNFYIGFAVCIFSVLWFLVTLFSDGEKRKAKRLLADTGRFAAFSVLSGTLSAFTLLPLWYGMKNWISSTLTYSDGGSAFHPHTLAQIVDNLSMGIKPSLEFGVANLYCGSAALLFALLFLCNRKISWEKKFSYTLLSIFMLLSFEMKILDYVWHGFHFPNQLPARQSFLFVFVMLLMAYETLSRLDGLTLPKVCIAALLSGGVMLAGFSESQNKTGRLISVLIILLSAVFLAARVYLHGREAKVFISFLLAGVIALDAIVFAVYSMAMYGKYYDAKIYAGVADREMAVLTAKYESSDDGFYRTEMTKQFTFDPAMLYDFKGISYYSSTMNGNLYRTLENLGNRVYAKNVSTIYQPTPIQDMMFGVRYHYERLNGLPQGYGKAVAKEGNITVLESPYALPVAYAVEEETANFVTEEKEGISAQDRFLRLATGISEQPFAIGCTVRVVMKENATIYRSNGKQYYSADPSAPSVIGYSFTALEDGPCYLCFSYTTGEYSARINGGQEINGTCGSEPMRYIGDVKAGDEVTVKVTTKGYSTVLCGMTGYVMNEAMLNRAYRKLSDNALVIDKASDTRIEGTIRVQGDMLMYSSIPAENGWRVYLDGKETETVALDGAFLCFKLPAGEHRVEYRYEAPGLTLGILISLLSAGILAAYFFLFRGKKRACRAPLSADETSSLDDDSQ